MGLCGKTYIDLSIWANVVDGFCKEIVLESKTFGNNLSQRERIGERFLTDCRNWVLSPCMHVQTHSSSDEVGRNRCRWEEF